MQAWIGNLAAYNNGSLKGEWVTVSTDEDTNAAHIARICGDVEHYVADYDETCEALARRLGEYPSAADLAHAATILEAAEERDSTSYDLLDAYIDASNGNPLEDLADEFEDWISDTYAGTFDSLTDFAEHICEECGTLDAIPENLRSYFDFEAYGRDLRLGGDVFTVQGTHGVLVFWSR